MILTQEEARKCAEIMCKQSAEVLEERLHKLYLSHDKTSYLVCFDNGYSYSHVSALELYNFQKLKIEYNRIHKDGEEYAKSLCNKYSTVISGEENIEKLNRYKQSMELRLNEIIKAAQLFIMPFNREIEKIIDETTNQVVKI